MNVTLSLNPEVEKVLLIRAQACGVSLDGYLQELVEKDVGLVSAEGNCGEEKARAFVQWAKSHRDTPPLSDESISRASMYPDRW